ncbi:sensor histidine kinase [Limimonas halophila]|uniref:sensor histidine kinase n=1 Tax=Limimonas halophila TaxID=1082479 RepID=UPI000B7F148E|nr:HAMP domain-containing sensor histidine kinase [Limimonas halophila]
MAAKLGVVVAVFVAVPLLLYQQFHAADQERRQLLLESLENQGRIVGESLRPSLQDYDGETLQGIADRLQRMAGTHGLKIKLLLRPDDNGSGDGFYYIASAPRVSTGYLKKERAELADTGVLRDVQSTCGGNRPLDVAYTNPAGKSEVLTSITPVRTEAGCWAVITSYGAGAPVAEALEQPYWQTPEVRIALAIYVVMAVLVLALMTGVYRSLRRFVHAARRIRRGGLAEGGPRFQAINRVPELDGVAAEFDRMVTTLNNAAHAMRRAAEDNTHAFKTPIATIAQAVEPLKRSVGDDQPRARRAVDLIERSVTRLDTLVAASRKLDEATAELMEAPRERIDLAALVTRLTDAYAETAADHGMHVERELQHGIHVAGSADMLESVLENLLDNGMDFSPRGGTLHVRLTGERRTAEISVADEGPGVDADRREQIFDRYVSTRVDADAEAAGDHHFGIGLWLVRRNVEALGGSVHAEANDPHGLKIRIRIPRVG